MALINCPECGKEISDQASVCPNCGVKIASSGIEIKSTPKKNFNGKLIIVAVILIAIVGVIAWNSYYQKYSKVNIIDTEAYLGYGDVKGVSFEGDELTWSSSNEAVAKVQNGQITGVGEGTATITATSKFGQTDTMTVNVAWIIDDWTWDSMYVNGSLYTSSEYKSSLSIDGKNIKLENFVEDLNGTWEYKKTTDEGSLSYTFIIDGYSFDLNIIVTEHDLAIGAVTDDTGLAWFFTR